MNNEKQETIEDIVREMRTLGRLDEESTDKIPRSLQALGLRTYADRIEAAANQSVTNCNRLVNAAKMREALYETKSVIEKCLNILRYIPEGNEYDEILDEVANNLWDLQKIHVKPAISAPPRNCDVLSKAEVLEMLKDRSFSKEDTIEWLYDKAKGGAEWMV